MRYEPPPAVLQLRSGGDGGCDGAAPAGGVRPCLLPLPRTGRPEIQEALGRNYTGGDLKK